MAISPHVLIPNRIRSHIAYFKVAIASQFSLLDEENNNAENIIYSIIRKLYEIGELEKAYNLTKKISLESITDQDKLNYFYFIELNYFYESYRTFRAVRRFFMVREKQYPWICPLFISFWKKNAFIFSTS